MKSLIALLLLTTPAMADEFWSTPKGEAFYDIDVNQTAVFAVPMSGTMARFYIPGLVGVWPRSMMWDGYWILPDTVTTGTRCDAVLSGPDGVVSHVWGHLLIEFDDLPQTGWTAVLGDCFAGVEREIRAEPVPVTGP